MESDTPYTEALRKQGVRLPAILCQIRTDEGRRAQSNGIDVFKGKFLTPRPDRLCNCLTGVQKDNLIMKKTDNDMENLTYYPHPTKEQLLEYFSQRIAIRKMTSKEAFRLMSVSDEDIEKIQAYPFKTYAERKAAIAKADKKELVRIKRESICKTAQYRLAGNSIVTDCLYWIFYKMFIDTSAPVQAQPNLFDFTD